MIMFLDVPTLRHKLHNNVMFVLMIMIVISLVGTRRKRISVSISIKAGFH